MIDAIDAENSRVFKKRIVAEQARTAATRYKFLDFSLQLDTKVATSTYQQVPVCRVYRSNTDFTQRLFDFTISFGFLAS